MESTTCSWSTTGICEKCGKHKYYLGDPVDQEFLDSYLCHCERWEYPKNKLLIERKDLWEALSKNDY